MLRALALRVDRQMLRIPVTTRTRRRLFATAGLVAVVGLAVATTAFDLPQRFDENSARRSSAATPRRAARICARG